MPVTISGSTGVVIPDGSSSVPSLSHSGDLNCGLYFPTADSIALVTAGTAAVTLSSGQYVNINTTGNTNGRTCSYDTAVPQFLAYGYSRVGGASANNGALQVGNNSTFAGVLDYDASGNTSLYLDNTYDSASAVTKIRMRTAGTAVTAMTLLGSGNVGVGTTSPLSKFVISDAGAQGIEFQPNDTNRGFIITYNRNSGAYYPMHLQADTFSFRDTIGGSSMYIDNSANVGVGTTSPVTYGKFVVNATGAQTAGAFFSPSGTSQQAILTAYNPTNNAYVSFAGVGSSSAVPTWTNGSMILEGVPYSSGDFIVGAYTGNIVFQVNNRQSVARITSSGDVWIGKTTTTGSGRLEAACASNTVPAIVAASTNASDEGCRVLLCSKYTSTTTTSQVFVQFSISNNSVSSGQINANGSAQAAFGTWSDARLKRNIIDLPSQLDNILALRPREFDYIKSEGGGHQISFVAQEMQQVYPDAVGEREDGMLTITGWGKTEARLVKAIQELAAKVTALEEKVI